MSTLYELAADYQILADMMEDPETDPQVIEDTMEGIVGEIEDKADGYAKVMRNFEAQVDGIDKEVKRLQERKRTIAENVKRMKTRLQQVMEVTGKTKFKTDLFSFGIQNNPPSVVMDAEDLNSVPERFVIVETSLNKTAVKEAIKQGEDLTGIAHLEQTQSLRIR